MITLMITFYFSRKRKIARNAAKSTFLAYTTAGDERIELPPKVLETPIIPFDQSPIIATEHLILYSSKRGLSTLIFEKYIHDCQSLSFIV